MTMASLKQGKQVLDLLSDASVEELQQLIGAGDLLKLMLQCPDLRQVDREGFRRVLQVKINPYAHERVPSSYGYPAGYKPKPVDTQLKVLSGFYPELDGSHVEALASGWQELPEGAELLQVSPKLSSVSRTNKIKDVYRKGLGQCLELMFGHIAESRSFVNYCKGQLTSKHVRLLDHSRRILKRLETETPGDYLVFPMQSGLFYRGASLRCARFEIQDEQQWGLSPWEAGHHLLTHPERLSTGDELWIDCPGAEYSLQADGGFVCSLCFSFRGGYLWFGYVLLGFARAHYGSVSAFPRE